MRRFATNRCRESGLGLLIARDGEQAIRAIERFGPPLLLIVDLALPVKDGFAVIEAVRRGEGQRSEVLAWAGSREMREYASARLQGFDIHVISDTAPRATMRAAIAHAIEPKDVADDDSANAGPEPDDLRQRMSDLSNRARQLCGTPGVGIYMKVPGETHYSASFAWISDDLMPHSPHHLPRAFEQIAQTGESIFAVDLNDHAPAADGIRDAVRGLAGVPIVAGGEVLGAICVFDIKPLQIDERSFSSLKTLGHVAFDVANVVLPGMPAAPGFRDRASDRAGAGAQPGDESQVRPPAVDWPPSLLERRGGEFAVARELARARREGHQLSVILFDCAPVEQRGGRDRRHRDRDGHRDVAARDSAVGSADSVERQRTAGRPAGSRRQPGAHRRRARARCITCRRPASHGDFGRRGRAQG